MTQGYARKEVVLPVRQPNATLSNTPTVNTYYTLLDTVYDAEIYSVEITLSVQEAIEFKVTIDGQTLIGAQATPTATQPYGITGASGTATNAFYVFNSWSEGHDKYKSYILRGHSIKIEVRKTTNNNAATTLSAICKYALLR